MDRGIPRPLDPAGFAAPNKRQRVPLWLQPYPGALAGLLGAFLLILWASLARPATLTCTAPTGGQAWTRIFDPELGDSTWSVECSGGTVIHDSLWVFLWRQPVTGGGFQALDSVYVAPGDSCHFTVTPGHYYAVARNRVGPSCVTAAPVYVPPLDPTGVPVEAGDPVVACRLFDVRGRFVARLPGTAWYDRTMHVKGVASGVYYLRGVTRLGRSVPATGARRVVVVR